MGFFSISKPKEKEKPFEKLYRVKVEPVEEKKEETHEVEVEQPKEEKEQEVSYW